MLYIITSRFASGNGSCLKTTVFNNVKTDVLVPIHNASVTNAANAKAFCFQSSTNPNLMSCNISTVPFFYYAALPPDVRWGSAPPHMIDARLRTTRDAILQDVQASVCSQPADIHQCLVWIQLSLAIDHEADQLVAFLKHK